MHGDFILQRSMPAPALESAQAALQGVQILMTRKGGGKDEAKTGGWVGGEGRERYTLTAGSSASNEGLKGSTHSTVGPIGSRQSR